MEIQNDCNIPQCGTLPIQPGQRVVVGAKQLKKVLCAGQALQVFLARDADPAITAPLETLCCQQGVPCTWVPAMADLGRVCGIDVAAAAAAIVL